MARKIHESSDLPFFEVFVDTPLEICEKRDTKGLYEKARKGIIKGFTGIDQEYQKPEHPELVLKTANASVNETMMLVIEMLKENVCFYYFIMNHLLKYCFQGILPQHLQNDNINGFDSSASPVKELFIDESRIKQTMDEIQNLPKVSLTTIDLQWLQVLSEGWATPLNGFMREDEFLQVSIQVLTIIFISHNNF